MARMLEYRDCQCIEAVSMARLLEYRDSVYEGCQYGEVVRI